ncbi:hypothetical protein GCM10007105_28160 [Shewanella chilikensis]|nr:hypothetical protein GCM10007105_28160 [Shewanella chilikensis]
MFQLGYLTANGRLGDAHCLSCGGKASLINNLCKNLYPIEIHFIVTPVKQWVEYRVSNKSTETVVKYHCKLQESNDVNE